MVQESRVLVADGKSDEGDDHNVFEMLLVDCDKVIPAIESC